MRLITRISNAIKWGFAAFRTPGITSLALSGLAERLTQAIEEAAKTGQARMFYVADVSTEIRLLTIWCGIGEETPLMRIEELHREIAYLKRTRGALNLVKYGDDNARNLDERAAGS